VAVCGDGCRRHEDSNQVRVFAFMPFPFAWLRLFLSIDVSSSPAARREPCFLPQRLEYEILHLQHEKSALEKELVAIKRTVATLTEKLGKAGERLKTQHSGF
jgi:hypothetical protein